MFVCEVVSLDVVRIQGNNNLTKLSGVYNASEVGSRRNLAPHRVDFALRTTPRLDEFPSALKDALRITRAMTRVVAGDAPDTALPGFPALLARLKEVYDLVVSARSALAAGSIPDVERHLGQVLELLSSFNLMAMWDVALQSVENFAHPLFVPGQDTRVQTDLFIPVVGATSMVETPLSDLE
jgi:hypothetical protein